MKREMNSGAFSFMLMNVSNAWRIVKTMDHLRKRPLTSFMLLSRSRSL